MRQTKQTVTGFLVELLWALRVRWYMLRVVAKMVWNELRLRAAHETSAETPKHARTDLIHSHATLGERLADVVAGGMGSWTFIICQTALVVVWMLGNVWLLSRPFDPYPFILLNLAFSTQAAYAAPLIQMSQNRQAAKDRLRDDREAQEVDLMTSQLALLEQINRQQLDILTALHAQPASPAVAQPAESSPSNS